MKIASRPQPVNDISAAMVPIVTDGRCVGFLLRRGREGIEAYDRDELSLGLFACPIEGARAVEKTACPGDGDAQ